MLYHLLYPLHNYFSVFNVFRYITFRTIYASLTAFFICFLLGPWVIRKLGAMQVGQYIRDDGPQSHYEKAGTPTMGGLLIVGAVAFSTLLWSDLTNSFVWIVLFVVIGYGFVGFIDDYLMQIKKQSKGLSVRKKFVLQFILALIAGGLVYMSPNFSTERILDGDTLFLLPSSSWAHPMRSTSPTDWTGWQLVRFPLQPPAT
jgi:phospho-N-acetylmuramoyl-pentapeptide-transferase